MTKYILHDESYDVLEVFDTVPTSNQIDNFISENSGDKSYIAVYEIRNVGYIESNFWLAFDDKNKDC